jgi:hypothetical protein
MYQKDKSQYPPGRGRGDDVQEGENQDDESHCHLAKSGAENHRFCDFRKP